MEAKRKTKLERVDGRTGRNKRVKARTYQTCENPAPVSVKPIFLPAKKEIFMKPHFINTQIKD